MSRKRDEKIAELAERLGAVLNEIDETIAGLPGEFRDVLAGRDIEPAESEEGEAFKP